MSYQRNTGRNPLRRVTGIHPNNLEVEMETIDMTPTWKSLLPAMLAVLKNGSFESKRDILSELQRMAHAADLYVAAEKERNLTWSMDNYPPKWERPALLALVKAILKRGHTISIYLEDEPMIEHSGDLAEVIKNLAAGDLDSLVIETDGGNSVGWFSLIYNNGSEHEPMIVISDHSANEVCNEIMREVEQEVGS
jgi:hypothetical protein